jgi:hypothetical protein
MFEPIRIDEDGREVYTSDQIEVYGLPITTKEYYVLDLDVTAKPMLHTYETIQNFYFDKENKKVHRYCRKTRFRTTLAQLLGLNGFNTNKSKDMVNDIIYSLPWTTKYLPPCKAWEELRTILKRNQKQIFYNRIPAIAHKISNFVKNQPVDKEKIILILNDFEKMHNIFPKVQKELGRVYFPSLRFTALKLCAKYDIIPPVQIPLCRTMERYFKLSRIYSTIWCHIADYEFTMVLNTL